MKGCSVGAWLERRRLYRRDPRERWERKEPNVATGEDQRVGHTFEPAELGGEEVEALRATLVERPLLSAVPCDELPELEVVARDVIGTLLELHLVAAAHDAETHGLERREAAERGQELTAQAPSFLRCRRGA